MKKGFTMIELLVVIGIISILMAVLVSGFKNAPEKAELAKCQELVKNTETALVALFDETGAWPKCLIANNNAAPGLDATAAYPLASRAGMSLTYDSNTKKLSGIDRLGIVTPWAAAVVKQNGTSASENDRVPIGGTVAEHRLFYALDLDGDGAIEGVNPASTVENLPSKLAKPVNIRATAAVWCRGPKGKLVTSWTDGQTEGVR